jgi:hypothetical protein
MQPDFATAPEVREATKLVNEIVAHVSDDYVITTAEQYTEGAEHLKLVKGAQRKLEDLRTAITKPLNAALKAANDLFRAPAERLVAAERRIKTELGHYAEEQERIRREEQRKADEKARQERIAAEQKAAEARRKAEEEAAELRRKAEEEAAAGRAAEAAKLAARAEQKVEKADIRAAELEQQAATVVAPIITREPPKVAGVSGRENWYAECTDLKALVAAIAAGQAPLSLVQANEKVLGQQARSLKSEFRVPGVRVYCERGFAAGTA